MRFLNRKYILHVCCILLILIFLFSIYLPLSFASQANVEIVNLTYEGVIIKISSDEDIESLVLYKKDNSGKFVQFYKSSEKNYRNKNLFISNMQLSNSEKTSFKVVINRESNNIVSSDFTVAELPERPKPAPSPSITPASTATPNQPSTPSASNNTQNNNNTNNQNVTSVSLNKSAITLDLSGTKSAVLKASVSPASAQTAFTWSTSNKSIATVSNTGVVTAKAVGTATITIKTSNNKTSSCKITVQDSALNNKTRAAFIAALDKFSKQVKKDGNWGYYNSMATNGWTFQQARAKKRRSAQCAALPYWGLVEIGVLDPGDSFYGKGGKIYWRKEASTKAKLKKYAKIIKVNKTPNQLLKANNLKVGDICLWSGHTNVYAGNGKWYDAGHASCTTHKGSYSYDRFRSFGPVKNSMNSTVYYIIRLNK